MSTVFFEYVKSIKNKERMRAEAYITKGNDIILTNFLDPMTKKKVFSLPGGSVEPNESIKDGLIRECLEEIGIEMKNIKLIYSNGYIASSKTRKIIKIMIHSFVANFNKYNKRILGSGPEGRVNYDWFSIIEAYSLLQKNNEIIGKNPNSQIFKMNKHALYVFETFLL